MPFIWPLNGLSTPDEMNTSYGPRIDADRWDFHDGIDLPAAVGTPVHAMAEGTVLSAGPADRTGTGQGFGSTHVLIHKVVDPMDGKDDLFLVYLHLDSIAEAIRPGATVRQGDLIGTVGQEDATYPHLHFEFRKGSAQTGRQCPPAALPAVHQHRERRPFSSGSLQFLRRRHCRSAGGEAALLRPGPARGRSAGGRCGIEGQRQ